MPSIVGFSRRVKEATLLWLRQTADRHSTEVVHAAGVAALFRCTTLKELGRVRAVGGEPAVLDWLSRSVKPGDCVYDIGANTGFYTILAAKLVGPTGQVVAFEPEGHNFARLQSNVLINGLDNVIAGPFAISESNGSALLRLHSSDAGEGAHALVSDGGNWRVFLFTLDGALDLFGLPSPMHLKIDVEGHEESVLRGMSRCLGSETLRTIMVEAHYFQQLSDTRRFFDDAELEAKRQRLIALLGAHRFALTTDQLSMEDETRYAHMVFERG
jgi:FkbM family methyltransferase